MIKGLKICGVSDPKTLNFILNHNQRPAMIGFITNYEKSKRFVKYEKLKSLINFNKKDVSFVSVLVKPNDEILEKIKDLDFVQSEPGSVGLEACFAVLQDKFPIEKIISFLKAQQNM